MNGTATGGADFQSVDRRVEFTTETEQSFSLPVLDDTATEGTETFRIEVSEGAGCQVNPNFGYGAPVTVTIKASDAALASPAASAAPTKSVATQPNAVRTTAPAATVAPSGTATPAAAITSPPPTSIAPLDTASDTSTEPPIAPVGAGDDGGDGVLLARVLLSW